MPNYNETPIAGTSFQRCSEIIIANPYQGVPAVVMREERVAVADGQTLAKVELPITLTFAFNPGNTFTLLNPLTDEPTGQTLSAEEIYAIIYSVYRQKAAERDSPPENNE